MQWKHKSQISYFSPMLHVPFKSAKDSVPPGHSGIQAVEASAPRGCTVWNTQASQSLQQGKRETGGTCM